MNNKYNEIEDFLDEIVETFNKFLSMKIMKKDIINFKDLVVKISDIFEIKMNKFLKSNSFDYNLNSKYEHAIELEKEVKCKYDISFCNTI